MSTNLETTPATEVPKTAAPGSDQQQVATEKLMAEALPGAGKPGMGRCGSGDGGQFRDTSGGTYPEIQPVTVSKDGGKITIDEFNRVTQIQDATNRSFQFSYDNKSGELNKLTNQDGTWVRQTHHGKYTDEWKNENGQKWKGDVTVGIDGYSFTSGNKCTSYTADGCETHTYKDNGAIYYTDKIMPDGQHKIIDGRLPQADQSADATHKVSDHDKKSAADGIETKVTADGIVVTDKKTMKETTYFDEKKEHIKCVRDLKNHSVLEYDKDGHLTSMKDACGEKTSFGDYDKQGNPHTFENGRGLWHKVGPDLWSNDKPNPGDKAAIANKLQYVTLKVDKDSFTTSDLHGRTLTRSVDGTQVEKYKGITTTRDAHGQVTRQFADGSPIEGEAVHGNINFAVKKGDTKSARLSVSGSDFEVVHARGGDVHAHIEAPAKAPVTAMQDGLVVYSYNHDPNVAAAMEQRSTSVIGLSPADMDVIDQYRKNNPNGDVTVMQCYDPKTKGVRYEIYAGLALANAAPGTRVKAGDILGTAGDNGYVFGARKQRVSGGAIDLDY